METKMTFNEFINMMSALGNDVKITSFKAKQYTDPDGNLMVELQEIRYDIFN